MNKRKITFVLFSITSITSMVGVLTLTNHFESVLSQKATADRTYALTIRANDLEKNYAVSDGGARLDFESSGVTPVNSLITIAKNGYIRMTVPINGSTSVSIDTSSFSDDDKLTMSSGYSYNDYGAACYLTKTNNTAETYYRTYLQFSSDNGTISLPSITIYYTCSVHYEFTPQMEDITENVEYNKPEAVYSYDGLSYVDDIEPLDSEVDIVKERFVLDLSEADSPDPVYSIHPVAKFYDKGGCLIKQVEGFWLCHVNPIIRFYISKDKFYAYDFVYGDTFDCTETGPLYSGVLSGFDWSEYTQEGGVLTEQLTKSMDLYPRVVFKINPGVYTEEVYQDIDFTPNPNLTNYGFPSIPSPSVPSPYNFVGWVNGEEYYDPATAKDFHDYDLYAEFNSPFDLRLKFQNRGFNNAYYELGVGNGETIQMPGTDTYNDQTTTGLKMGQSFEYNDGTGQYFLRDAGYLVYPEGHRDEATFYSVGQDFKNDGYGTIVNPATYIAEPYVEDAPSSGMFQYLQFDIYTPFKTNLIATTLHKHCEHMYYDGVNDTRTYFKKIILPDSHYTNSGIPAHQYAVTYCTNGTIECNLDDHFGNSTSITGIGIVDSLELEVVVGNEHFNRFDGLSSGRGYSFKNNAELRRLEHFPSIDSISKYTFWNCQKLEPLQNWVDIGDIDSIGEHAFDSCYINPITDSAGNISRRRFELPTSLQKLENYVFAKAVYTDFYIDSENLSTLSLDSFAYSDDGSHSEDFANMVEKYNNEEVDLAAVKAVANHVIFNGTQAKFESLVKTTYNELDVLLNKEYYVTFME